MPTLTGTITDSHGTPYTDYVRFTLHEQPQSKSGVVINHKPAYVKCSALGYFSITLVSGCYWVEQVSAKPYKICFGNDTTYDLADLISGGVTAQVETPVISPDGGTFGATQLVTITCATVGASMYYTIDGTTPSSLKTPYTAPFLLSASATVKVIGIMTGYIDSTIKQAVFTQLLTSPVYYGKSLSVVLDEAGVLGLTAVSMTSAIGDYNFAADDGYSYFATPAAWATPTALKIGGFDVPLWQTAPFDTYLSGLLYYMPLTVGAVAYRVFRSYHSSPGAWTMTVT